MINLGRSAYDALVDMSADELLGALLLGAIMAMTLAGLFALLRKRTADSSALVGGLVLVACLASTTLALGFANEKHQRGSPFPFLPRTPPTNSQVAPTRIDGPGPGSLPRPPIQMSALLAQVVMDSYDLDHDGRLTHEEATHALAEILKDAAGRPRTSLDRADLELIISHRLQD